MFNFSEKKWLISLFLSGIAIVFGTLVREGVFTLDIVKRPKPVDAAPTPKLEEPSPVPKAADDKPSSEQKEPWQDTEAQGFEKQLTHLREELGKKLTEAGFTSAESDKAAEIITATFGKNIGAGVDSISLALDEAAKILELDANRKDQVRKALLASFAETGGSFSTDDFKSCMERRVKFLKADPCSSELAEQFAGEFYADYTGVEKITPELQEKVGNSLTRKYVKLSETCGISTAQAEKLFEPHLSSCPKSP